MSIPAQYLEPVSSDAPCGDVASVGSMWQIDGLFTPSGSELLNWKPDWKEVAKVAERLLPNCKHVKLAIVYAGMALQKNDLPGFRDGLNLLMHWLESYWDHLYPQLDKELVDPYEQMIERINELRNLTSQGIGGIAVLTWLNGAIICKSRSFGNLNFRAVAIVRGLLKPVEGETLAKVGDAPMTMEQLDRAFSEFRETAPDQMAAQVQAVKESHEILSKLDSFLSEKAGAGRGPSLSPLSQVLETVDKCFAPYIDGAVAAQATAPVPSEGVPPIETAVRAGGKVASREDVLKSIAAICDYYRQCEPSSPVPLLLQRAGRLVKMDFLAIVEDLAIENAEQAKRILVGDKKGSEENAKT
jgi:type VI secretion system protein ImpA